MSKTSRESDGEKTKTDKRSETKADAEGRNGSTPLDTGERSSAPTETAGAQVAAVTLANLTGLLRTASDPDPIPATPEEPEAAAAPMAVPSSERPSVVQEVASTASVGEPPAELSTPASPKVQTSDVDFTLGEVRADAPDAEDLMAAMSAPRTSASRVDQTDVPSWSSSAATPAGETDGEDRSEAMPEMEGTPQSDEDSDSESRSDDEPAPQDDEPEVQPRPEIEPEPEGEPQPEPAEPPRLTGTINDYQVEISDDRTSVRFTDIRPESPDGVVDIDVGAALILSDATLVLRVSDTVEGDLSPGAEAELLIGEAGATLRFDDAVEGVGIDLSSPGVGQAGVATGDVQTGFQNIVGSDHGDTLNGGAAGGALDGGAGNDELTGGAAADTLTGGDGDDAIDGGEGIDLAVFAGDLENFAVSWDATAETFAITDLNAADGLDEGRDLVSGVETFRFNGRDVTADELRTEAARQANTAPEGPSINLSGAVPEDAAAGHLVATLAAADPDGDAIAFTLTDADGVPLTNSPFEIVGDEIRVAPGAALDFETADAHTLFVTSSDGFETSPAVAVTVSVSDAAEVLTLADGGAGFTDSGVAETSVIGGDGDDAIAGLSGDNDLQGRGGADVLFGGDGADTLTGGEGADVLAGGAGDDLLRIDGEDAAVDGGDGRDRVIVDGDDAVSLDLAASRVEDVTGGAGADLLDASGATEGVTISGGGGDDTLLGGAGDDELAGGDGIDSLVFDGAFSDYSISESGGVYTIADNRPGGGADTFRDVEVLEFADQTVPVINLFNDAPTDIETTDVSAISLNADGGNNAYLKVTDNGDILGGLSEFTAEVQFSSAGMSGGLSPLMSYNSNGVDAFLLGVRDTGSGAELRFEVGSAGRVVPGYDASELFDGRQHQISITWDSDGGVWEVFVDGDSVGGGSGVRPGYTLSSGGELVLGQEQDAQGGAFSTDQVFEGAYHDVRIFNDVRTDAEIRDGALATVDPAADGLVANWTMDGLADGEVEDVVGGRDLSVANVAGPGWIDSTPAEVITTFDGANDDAFVARVTGVDPNAGDTLEYALQDDAGGRFAIDPATGIVTVADGDLLAGDAGITHEIVVVVSDDRGGSYEETLSIAVDDLIVGAAGDDALTGTDGSDRIVGMAGADTIAGGIGDDEVRGGDGADTMTFSSALADTQVSYDADSDSFTLTDLTAADGVDEGVDRVTGVETFQFSDGAVTASELRHEAALQANAAPDAPTLASGGSVAENSAGGTVVATLAATDAEGDALTYMLTDAHGAPVTDDAFEIVGNEIRVKSGADIDFEAAQSHTLHVIAADSLEASTPTEITLSVDDLAEVITLADGGDSFVEAGVTETMVYGGDGADALTGGDGDDAFDGNGGDDTLTGGDGDDRLYGDAGDDAVFGGGGADLLEGGGGNDSVNGFHDDDTIDGGTGNDTLEGHSGNDLVYGGQGEDRILGGGGDDTLFGGVQDDFIGGYFGDDSIDGGDGEDLMYYDGALEDFSISYDADTDVFTITDDNAADGLDEGADTITGIEEFRFAGEDYTADEIRALAKYQTEIGEHGPVGHWSFAGTSGAAVDRSATGNDGVLRGDTAQGAAGPFAGAGAISLDGDGDYVEIVDNDAYDLPQGTISIWIQPNALDETQAILSRESQGDHDGDLQVWLHTDGSISVRHQEDGDSERLTTEAGVVNVGDWANVTYTWGPEGMQIAVDGQTLALNDVARSLEGSNEPFTVGADQWKSTDGATDNLEHFFDGQISEFVILSERLESEEIADLYFALQPADDGASITSAGGADILYGDAGDDTLSGGMGNDTIKGRGGDDTIDGRQHDDVAVYDGNLADFAISHSGSTFTITDLNTADGDEGTDTVTRVEAFEFGGVAYTEAELQTEAARQANTAPDAPSVASGGSVAENSADGTVVATLTATDADGDAITYTLSDASGTPVADDNFEIVGNEIRVKTGADIDFEAAQSHTLHVTASDAFETTAPTEITVTVDDQAETIILDAAGEHYVEQGVTETIVRGDGNGGDSIVGGSGDDLFDGWAGDDTLEGRDGDDRLNGGDHDDLIFGGAGDDVISGLWGDDTVHGGVGEDVYSTRGLLSDFEVTYDADANAFTLVDLSADHDGFMGTDVVADVEEFYFTDREYTAQELRLAIEDQPDRDDLGAAGDQTLTGDSDPNTFYGGAGDDDLDAQGGDDTLYGGSGADTINAGLDEDLIYAGSGADVVFGGQGADSIHGDGGDDSLVGGEGDDYLMGGGGADTVEGGLGEDLILGGTGNDLLDGGDGSDSFRGGPMEGDDTIVGGVGGGWTDIIELEDVGGPISVSGDTVTGDGWTLTLDSGHSVVAQGADQLDLSEDAAGTILFDDGGSLDFQGVEAVTW